MSIILQSEEHILGLDDGKTRFIREVTLLSQALLYPYHIQEQWKSKTTLLFSSSKSTTCKI
jgi:type I restriction enzyme R subunit